MTSRRAIGRWVVAFAAALAIPAASATWASSQEAEAEPGGWHDPILSWPDPLGESLLDVEATYYWFTRGDRASLLPAPTAERPLRIYVGGDSLSGGPAFGFELLVDDDPRFELTTDVRLSTGVITEWFFDWRAYLADTVAEGGYDVIVLSMGGNDGQRFSGHRDLVGSDPWKAMYQARVAEMLVSVDRPGRFVVWVGMPPVTLGKIAELPAIVNPLTEAVARGRRTAYLDAAAIVAPDGVFTRTVVDEEGRDRTVRSSDGVHYTRDGGRLLADQILDLIDQRSG